MKRKRTTLGQTGLPSSFKAGAPGPATPGRLHPVRLYQVGYSRGRHIIAVGGAGSLGSPALDIGNPIIKAARPPITASPAR
jgi:hypothetical protein